MKQLLSFATILLALAFQPATAQTPAQTPAPRGGGQGRGGGTAPPITAKPEELAKIKEKTGQIEALVKDLKAKRAKPELVGDVEVYVHAGKMLLEYPDMFSNQAAIEHAFSTLDQGIERGQQLQTNQPQTGCRAPVRPVSSVKVNPIFVPSSKPQKPSRRACFGWMKSRKDSQAQRARAPPMAEHRHACSVRSSRGCRRR